MKRAAAVRALVLVLAAVLGTAATSSVIGACGPTTVRPVASSASVDVEPRWQDVFSVVPEFLAVVHPRALRADRVYGGLLRRAIELARERSRIVTETRSLDAMEEAEEVIVGVRPPGPGSPGETVIVVRGVRGDLDPARLVDDDGRVLWGAGPVGPSVLVRELVLSPTLPLTTTEPAEPTGDASADASLFELPGNTWVIASGDARVRARAALARSSGTTASGPPLSVDEGSLAAVRLDGSSLVSWLRRRGSGDAIVDLGRGLESLTLELGPGAERDGQATRLQATLRYSGEDAAMLAEGGLREMIDAIARRKPKGLAWLAVATVERPGTRVVLAAPLPPSLVDGLLHAGTAPPDSTAPDAAAP